jgi:uncharacterized protein YjbJ (UPF0337 family)
MNPDNREEVAGGALGKVAGRLKEAAGDVLGHDDLAREGRLQEAGADAELEARKREGEARDEQSEADLETRKAETEAERARLQSEVAADRQEEKIERDRELAEARADRLEAQADVIDPEEQA